MAKDFILRCMDEEIVLPKEVEKYNPYHDSLGRFAAANGAAFFSIPKDPKLRDKLIEREGQRVKAAEEKEAADRAAAEAAKKPKFKILEGKAAIEYSKAQSDSWAVEISDAQRAAIRDYTENSYPINDYLRKSKVPEEGKKGIEIIETKVKLIDGALKKNITKEAITVYRGSSIEALGYDAKSKPTADDFAKLKGKVLKDKGFMSASMDKSVITGFDGSSWSKYVVHFEIKVPQGTKGSFINSASKTPNEAEFLFSKGSKMKIVDVQVKKTFTKHEINIITEVM
jgi:hypothetical protein